MRFLSLFAGFMLMLFALVFTDVSTLVGFAAPQEFYAVPQQPSQPAWQAIDSDKFRFNGAGTLRDHIENDHQHDDFAGVSNAEDQRKLHEWLHVQIESLRPNNAYSYIVVEASDDEFAAWSERAEIERAGWAIVRQPVRKRWANIVVIGGTHYSHVGRLTIPKLREFVDASQLKQHRQQVREKRRVKWVSKITMYTRAGCSWCDKWVSEELPKAQAEGVQIEFVTSPFGTVPRFDVCDENSCVSYVGFKTFAAMKAAIQ